MTYQLVYETGSKFTSSNSFNSSEQWLKGFNRFRDMYIRKKKGYFGPPKDPTLSDTDYFSTEDESEVENKSQNKVHKPDR